MKGEYATELLVSRGQGKPGKDKNGENRGYQIVYQGSMYAMMWSTEQRLHAFSGTGG